MLALLTALLMATAGAQEAPLDRPPLPSAGVATEGGPGLMWVNVANSAFDPDPRAGLWVSRDHSSDHTWIAASGGIGGLNMGVFNEVNPNGPNRWALVGGAGVRLPKRLAIGFLLNWNLVGEAKNYLSTDVSLAWRPLPWLGFGAAASNIGSPDPAGTVPATTAIGIGLRPFGRVALLGVDYRHVFGPSRADTLHVTARLRPFEGLYLRANVDSTGSVGGGLELYFAGMGVGGHVQHTQGDYRSVFHLGTDEPGETLIRSGRRVKAATLDGAPPYTDARTLLRSPKTTWLDLLDLLKEAESDGSTRGVSLTLGNTNLSWARCGELRDRIKVLEARGKPVLIYLYGSPTTREYWVATAARHVAIHPATTLSLTGLRRDFVHMRGLWDMIGVQWQTVRRSEFKTAPESNTRSGPSEAALAQAASILDDRWASVVAAMAKGRNVDKQTVSGWIDEGPWVPEQARDADLVDVVAYPDQLPAELRRLHEGYVRISALERAPKAHTGWENPSQIVIVYVDGLIVSGKSRSPGPLSPRRAGASTVQAQLDRARRNPAVRAVVLRVDSPGGSAFASDVIWRAVTQVQRAGKPVVVSMGGVAASGGYYVAASADAIWAQPTTVTGSIGVYTSQPVVSDLLERLGIETTTLARGRYAELDSPTHTWDAAERAKVEALVDATYTQFKSRVAEGRSLEDAAVEAVAGGRAWTGRQALEVGLVDNLGGLHDAIADARRRAGLPKGRSVELVTYTDKRSLYETLAPGLFEVLGAPATSTQRELVVERGVAAMLPTSLRHAALPLAIEAALDGEAIWMLDPSLVISEEP